MLLSRRKVKPGIEEFTLDIPLLYPDALARREFERRWKAFHTAQSHREQVFRRDCGKLIYLSECLIPKRRDTRAPALLLFGNPAPQSVASGMFFSYEGDGREHRVWKTFKQTGLLDFGTDAAVGKDALLKRNAEMKRRLLTLDYASPYRIGMAVYFSMPSSASDPVWSGVAGLRRLFGARALRLIEAEEQKRVCGLVNGFVGHEGKIFTFQKDGYAGLCAAGSPAYSVNAAIAGKLRAICKYDARVPIVGLAPTRLLLGGKALQGFERAVRD